jgi:8-oxo-dGTP diphosphatase
MRETHTFGHMEPGIVYTQRRAAYLVVVSDEGKVAMVRGRQSYFLPGGGAELGETPEETITREVLEELARSVRLLRKLGEAIQYFYAPADDRHYRMHASFFAGQFTDELCPEAEHELEWLPMTELGRACFHACHAWAVRQALK